MGTTVIKGNSKKANELNSLMEQSLFTHRIGIVQEMQTPYLHNTKINSSSEIIRYIQENNLYTSSSIKYEESFFVIALNKGNMIIGHNCLSIGGVSSCIAPPRKAMQFLMMVNATAFVCVHNHPSGRNFPSNSDIETTRNMKQAGIILDCTLLDHVIVCPYEGHGEHLIGKYYSFADEGMI